MFVKFHIKKTNVIQLTIKSCLLGNKSRVLSEEPRGQFTVIFLIMYKIRVTRNRHIYICVISLVCDLNTMFNNLLLILFQCNKMCDEGEQTREVVCIVRGANKKHLLPESQCEADAKPSARRSCNNGPCTGFEWITSDWSGVSIFKTYSRSIYTEIRVCLAAPASSAGYVVSCSNAGSLMCRRSGFNSWSRQSRLRIPSPWGR